jgi:hypothetical protein
LNVVFVTAAEQKLTDFPPPPTPSPSVQGPVL